MERTLEVFPNPVEDVVGLTFKLDASTPLTIEVLDASGRVVRTLCPAPAAKGATSCNSYALRISRQDRAFCACVPQTPLQYAVCIGRRMMSRFF